MHTLDSLARTLVAPAPARSQRRARHRQASVTAGLISIVCALAPLAVMTHVYLGAV